MIEVNFKAAMTPEEERRAEMDRQTIEANADAKKLAILLHAAAFDGKKVDHPAPLYARQALFFLANGYTIERTKQWLHDREDEAMTVWIVLKNGVVDEVFDNAPAAIAHRQNLIKKWNITKIIAKEVKSI
jgi:hypothetical protein